jgi:hypothetical protein
MEASRKVKRNTSKCREGGTSQLHRDRAPVLRILPDSLSVPPYMAVMVNFIVNWTGFQNP